MCLGRKQSWAPSQAPASRWPVSWVRALPSQAFLLHQEPPPGPLPEGEPQGSASPSEVLAVGEGVWGRGKVRALIVHICRAHVGSVSGILLS